MKHIIISLALLGFTACTGDEFPIEEDSSDQGSTIAPSSNGIEWQRGVFQDNNLFKNFCETPRIGVDPFTNEPYKDMQGTSLDEKHWLRAWSDEFYLWYDEIIDRDPASFTSVSLYFEQLKTNELTNSGNNRDNFHFLQETSSSNDFFENGITVSTGIQWRRIERNVPRDIRVVFVEPNSDAALFGIKRGDRLISIDGVDIINDQNADLVINNGLFPRELNESHDYVFEDADASQFEVTLSAQELVMSPVLYSDVLETTSGNVGYMVFNDHTRIAEQALVDTINEFNNQQVSEVILDLRYNGGGFLSVASRLSYMLSGPSATENRIFERIVLNDKHTVINPFTGSPLRPTGFIDRDSNNNPLPYIELERLYVITTSNTCSASESVMNALRGIDIEVIQIGGQTCGKPYGFYGTDNCGTTYFSINFRGENDKGFGDYADGFLPQETDNNEDFIRGCSVLTDDLSYQLGDIEETMLSTALFFLENDQCPNVGLSQEKTQVGPEENLKSNVLHIEKSELRKNKYILIQ